MSINKYKLGIIFIFIHLLLIFSPLSYCLTNIQTLKSAVHTVLLRNPTALQSIESTNVAKQNYYAAFAGFLPKIDTDFTTSRGKISSFPHFTTVSSGIVITEPIYSGLGTYNLVKQRRFDLKRAKLNEASTKEFLALEVAIAYLEVLQYTQTLKLTRESISDYKTLRKLIDEKKRKFDKNFEADIDLIDARVNQRQTTIEQTRNFLDNAKADFKNVVGFEHDRLKLPNPAKIPRSLIETKRIAFQHNFPLLAAKLEIKSRTAAVSVSKARLLPQIDLSLNYDHFRDIGVDSERTDSFQGSVSVYYNLFNGGSDYANIQRSIHFRMSSIYRLDQIYRDLESRVANIWSRLLTNEVRIKEESARVISTNKVYKEYINQYKNDQRSFIDVLNIESELFNARITLLRYEYAYRIDQYSLLAQMGKLVQWFKSTTT